MSDHTNDTTSTPTTPTPTPLSSSTIPTPASSVPAVSSSSATPTAAQSSGGLSSMGVSMLGSLPPSSMYAVYFLLDNQTLPNEGAVTAAIASLGSQAPMYDTVVISRDDIEQPARRVGFAAGTAGTPAKKKVVKKVEELSEAEERERALVTITDELIEGLRAYIDREISTRQESLAEQQRLANESLLSPSSPKSSSKTSKQRTSSKVTNKSKSSSTNTTSASASASTSTSNGGLSSGSRNSKRSSSSLSNPTMNDRPSSSSGRDAPSPSPPNGNGSNSNSNDSSMTNASLSMASSSPLSSSPAVTSIPLHIILRDVVRKVGDIERLHNSGISISAAFTFKPMDTAGSVSSSTSTRDSLEFLYGAPMAPLHRMSDELYSNDDDLKPATTTPPSIAATPVIPPIPPAVDDTATGVTVDKKVSKVSGSNNARGTGATAAATGSSRATEKKADDKKLTDTKRAGSSSGTNTNNASGVNNDEKRSTRVSSASSKKDKDTKDKPISLADRVMAEALLANDITSSTSSSTLMSDIHTLSCNDTRFRDIAVIQVSLPSPPLTNPSVGATGSNTNGNGNGNGMGDQDNDDGLVSPKSSSTPARSSIRTPNDASRSGEKKDVLSSPTNAASSSSSSIAGKSIAKKDSKANKSSIGASKGRKARSGDDSPSILQSQVNATSTIAQEILLQLRHVSGQISDYSVWRRDAAVIELPTSLQTLHADTRLYSSLMDRIDECNVSVPLLLHCLFEQVAANVLPSSSSTISLFNDDGADGLDNYLDQAFARVAATVAPSKPLVEPHSHVIPTSSITAAAVAGAAIGSSTATGAGATATNTGERQMDKNGHIWLHGRCIRCGDLQPLPSDLMNITATKLSAVLPATEYCPATVGGAHQWINGQCQWCMSREPITPADRMAHLAQFCPVTIGGVHLYDSQGECSACGAQLPSDNDASQSIACHAHDGNSNGNDHQWLNGICQRCGVSESIAFQHSLDVQLSRSRLLVSRGQMARGIRQCPLMQSLPTTTPPPTVMLKYGDQSLIRQAKLNLDRGGIWQPHHFTEVVDRLVADLLILPGVHHRGFPINHHHITDTNVDHSHSHNNDGDRDRGMEQTALLGRSSLSPMAYERALQCVQLAELMATPWPSFHIISSSPQLSDVFHPSMATRSLERSVRAKVRERVWATMALHAKNNSTHLIEKIVAQHGHSNNNSGNSNSNSNSNGNGTAAVAPVSAAPYLGASLSTGLGLPLHMIGYEDDGVARDWKLHQRIYREELDPFVLPQVLADASLNTISGVQHIHARYAAMDDSLLVAYHRHTPLTREMDYNWNDFLCPKMNFSTWQSSPAIVRNTPPRVMYNWANQHTGVLSRHIRVLYPCNSSVMGCTRMTSGHRHMVRIWMEHDGHLLALERDTQPPSLTTPAIVAGSLAAQEDERKRNRDTQPAISSTPLHASATTPATAPAATATSGDEHTRNLVLTHRYSDDTRTTISGSMAHGNMTMSYLNGVGLLTQVNGHGDIRMSYPRAPSLSRVKTRTAVISTMSSPPSVSASALPSSSSSSDQSDAHLYSVGRSNEAWRRVSCDGTVQRHMNDGSIIWLYANGDVARQSSTASSSSLSVPIIRTNMNGNRVAVYASGQQIAHDDISVARQIDAESGARITSRADLVQYTVYSDGSSLVQHADGTRIYMDIIVAPPSPSSAQSSLSSSSLGSKGGHRVTIECPDFPPVIYTHDHKFTLSSDGHGHGDGDATNDINSRHITQVHERHIIDVTMNHHDGTSMNMRLGEYVRLIKPIAGQLVMGTRGIALFVSNDALPAGTQLSSDILHGDIDRNHVPSSCYVINIMDGRIDMTDNEDNTFVCTTAGQSGVILGRNKGISSLSTTRHDSDKNGNGNQQMIPARFYPAPENAIEPRLFVIRCDGSGYELLTKQSLQRYIHHASCDPLAPLSILPTEYITNGNGNDGDDNDDGGMIPTNSRPVSHKFIQTLQSPSSYSREPVIPNVIKAGVSVATKSTPSLTSFVVYRHIMEYPSVSASDIQQVLTARDQYHIWRSNTLHRDEQLDVADVRTDQQRHHELLLANELLAERRRRALVRANDADHAATNERLVLDGVQHIPNGDIAMLPTTATATATAGKTISVSMNNATMTGAVAGVDHSIKPEAAASLAYTTSVSTPFPAAANVTTFFHARDRDTVATSTVTGTGTATRDVGGMTVKQPRAYASPSGIPLSSSTTPGGTSYFSHSTFQKRFAMGALVHQLRDQAFNQGSHTAVTTLLHDLCVFGQALSTLLTPSSPSLSSASVSVSLSMSANDRSKPSTLDGRLRARVPFTWNDQPLLSSLQANGLIRDSLPSFISLLGIDRAPKVVTLSSPFPLHVNISGKAAKRDNHTPTATNESKRGGNGNDNNNGKDVHEEWIVNDDVSMAEGLSTLQLELEKLQAGVTSLYGWNTPVGILREEKDHLSRTVDISRSTQAMHHMVNPNFTLHYNGEITASLRGASKQVVHMIDNDHDHDHEYDYHSDDSHGTDIKEAPSRSLSTNNRSMEHRLRSTLHGRPVVHQSHGASFVAPSLPNTTHTLRQSSTSGNGNSGALPSSSYRRASQSPLASASSLNDNQPIASRSVTNTTPMLHMVPKRGKDDITASGRSRTNSNNNTRGITGVSQSQSWSSSSPSSSPSQSQSMPITLQPNMIDFGNISKGGTYRVTFVITNISRDTCKFTIREPSGNNDTLMHLRILYRPGLIAPGLTRRVELELFAGLPGRYNQQVIIDTDKGAVTLPIIASVQPSMTGTTGTDVLPRVLSAGASPKSHSHANANANVTRHNTNGGFGRTGEIRVLSDQPTAISQSIIAAHQRRYASAPLVATTSTSITTPPIAAAVTPQHDNSATSGNGNGNGRPLSAIRRQSRPSSSSSNTSITADWVVVDTPTNVTASATAHQHQQPLLPTTSQI